MREVVKPRQVVLVTCREEAEILGKSTAKDNIISLAWHMPLSHDPPMYAISIGKNRFSLELVRKSGVFAVNFMAFSFADAIMQCGSNSGMHMNKFERFGLENIECEKIDCPRIGEALAHLECEVVEEVETGDHVLFIGRVVNTGNHKEGKRVFHLNGNKFTTTRD